jgi:SPP1 family predicted phage head-tail adaptor
MNAGRMRDRIMIQVRNSGQDSSGQPVETWTDLVELYAAITRLTGREYFIAQSTGAEISTRVLTRYYPGIKAADRLFFEGKIFDIDAVIPDQKRTQLEILCKEAG